MFSRIWFINIFLAVFVVFFGVKAYGVWSEGEKTGLQTGIDDKPEVRPMKRALKRGMLPESTYEIVVDKNLFSPERAEYIPEEPEPGSTVASLKISGKKVVLYGVVLKGSFKKALISNSDFKGIGKKALWVKVGDTVGDLKVADIMKDKVLLSGGAKDYEILLYDKQKPKRQATIAKKTGPVVVGVTPKKSKARQSKALKRKGASNIEYEIVNTPFGKIKRRKK